MATLNAIVTSKVKHFGKANFDLLHVSLRPCDFIYDNKNKDDIVIRAIKWNLLEIEHFFIYHLPTLKKAIYLHCYVTFGFISYRFAQTFFISVVIQFTRV